MSSTLQALHQDLISPFPYVSVHLFSHLALVVTLLDDLVLVLVTYLWRSTLVLFLYITAHLGTCKLLWVNESVLWMWQGAKHTPICLLVCRQPKQQGSCKDKIYPPSSRVFPFQGKELQWPKWMPNCLRACLCTCIPANTETSDSLVMNDSSQSHISFPRQH